MKYLPPPSQSRPTRFSVLGQPAVALHYVRQKGVAHRDIKPGNIMIGPPPILFSTRRRLGTYHFIGLPTARNLVRSSHSRLLA